MNRNERRTDIKFRKSIDFINLYFDLMDFLNIEFDTYGYTDKEGNIDKDSLLREDELDFHKSIRFNFEIFFGNKKVLVVFESDEDLQQKFIDRVCDNSQWFEPDNS